MESVVETKSCVNCGEQFFVTDKDLAFYDKVSPTWENALSGSKKYQIPTPSWCPYCRMQRRLTRRNHLFLYNRTCDKTGKKTISAYPPNSEYTIYANDVWWADNFDPINYGRDFDFNRTFFEQFDELEKAVPHYALFQEGTSENCEYTNYGLQNKNCYMAICAWCEDCYYCPTILTQSKSCIDCSQCIQCELCYECVDCTGCYNLLFSDGCQNCSDSYFLRDCRGCSNCFGGAGLRNKSYMWFSEQLTKEEYEKRLAEFKNDMTHEKIKKYRTHFEELAKSVPRKYMHGSNNENVVGDYINSCKNVYFGFNCYDLIDSKYCGISGYNSKDIYDTEGIGSGSELCYETSGGAGLVMCMGTYFCRFIHDVYYAVSCKHSEHLFGCFGLTRKKYCILNKQYSEEEYFKLRDKIIEHMRGTGEWGEYFPPSIAPHGYNTTLANEHFPMTREEVKTKGWKWTEDEQSEYLPQTYKIPECIKDVDESICSEVLACEVTGKNFKIIPQELRFYKKMELPIPRKHFSQRRIERDVHLNERRLWQRNCDKCNAEIWTSYSEQRPEIVYCESCYKAEIY